MAQCVICNYDLKTEKQRKNMKHFGFEELEQIIFL